MSTYLPGRAVDIVHAAAVACGRTVYGITVHLSYTTGAAREISLNLQGTVDESAGRAIFAALGVADATLGLRYGSRSQANLTGHIPALDVALSIIIDDLPPEPEPADPTALIAEVDAARAAADQAAPRDVAGAPE